MDLFVCRIPLNKSSPLGKEKQFFNLFQSRAPYLCILMIFSLTVRSDITIGDGYQPNIDTASIQNLQDEIRAMTTDTNQPVRDTGRYFVDRSKERNAIVNIWLTA